MQEPLIDLYGWLRLNKGAALTLTSKPEGGLTVYCSAHGQCGVFELSHADMMEGPSEAILERGTPVIDEIDNEHANLLIRTERQSAP